VTEFAAPRRQRLARQASMLVMLSLVLAGCMHAVEPAQTVAPEPYPYRIVDAAEIVGHMRHADVVADARLDAFRFESGADGMDGTMVWTAMHCHAGDCVTGQTFRTRFAAGFTPRVRSAMRVRAAWYPADSTHKSANGSSRHSRVCRTRRRPRAGVSRSPE